MPSDIVRQHRIVDSLKELYISSNVYIGEPVKVKAVLEEALKTITDSILYYELYGDIATCYFFNNDIDSAFILIDYALGYYYRGDTTDNALKALKISNYKKRGIMLADWGFFDSAVYFYKEALELCLDGPQDKLQIIKFHVNLASIYEMQGRTIEALENLRKALNLLNEIGWNESTTLPYYYVYLSLSSLYTELRNFELADHYLSIVEKDLDNLSLESKYVFMMAKGYLLEMSEKYEEALIWRKKLYEITRNIAYEDYRKTAECLLGYAYLCINELDSGKFYLDEAADYFLVNDDRYSSHDFRRMNVDYHIKKNNLKEAERILSSTMETYFSHVQYIYQRDNFRLWEELYLKKGDYRKAYEASKEVVRFNDSLTAKTIRDNILELSMRYQQDTLILRRDVLIAQQEQQVMKLENTNMIVIFSLIILFMIAVVVVYMIRKNRTVQYNRQLATINALRMENVRNRVSPHYILNVLNSILPSLSKHEETVEPVKLLIQSVRGNLLISEKMAVTLEEEMEIVRNYIALNKSMHPDAYEVKWVIAQDVEVDMLLPSMIIQIPVENAIKYAFDMDDKESANLITIDISRKDHGLFISIQDNGRGFDPDVYATGTRGTGTGLKILYRTIELLNIRNHQKMKFDIKDLKQESPDLHGTRIEIEIPFEYKYEL